MKAKKKISLRNILILTVILGALEAVIISSVVVDKIDEAHKPNIPAITRVKLEFQWLFWQIYGFRLDEIQMDGDMLLDESDFVKPEEHVTTTPEVTTEFPTLEEYLEDSDSTIACNTINPDQPNWSGFFLQ